MEKLSEVLMSMGLNKDQRHDVKEYICSHHGREGWIIPEMDQKGTVTFYITDEGARWLREVYADLGVPLLEGEVDFQKRRIAEIQSELEIWQKSYPKKYRKFCFMELSDLAEWFEKSPSAIYKAIKAMQKQGHEEVIRRRPTVISAQGVQWIEENIFLRFYLEDLIQYKLQLIEILEGDAHDRKSENRLHPVYGSGV